jgi:TRAP-type C4-dicarboxylate transport system permease small subunit
VSAHGRVIDPRIARWTRLIALVGFVGLLVQVAATMLDVLLRWLFNTPIYGLSDISQLVIVFMVAASFPASLAGQHNITIRFLGSALPPRRAAMVEAFGHVVMLGVFVLIAWQLTVFTSELFEQGRTTWMLGLPLGPSWILTTALVWLCVPIQAMVTLHHLRLAFGPGERFAATPDVEAISEL